MSERVSSTVTRVSLRGRRRRRGPDARARARASKMTMRRWGLEQGDARRTSTTTTTTERSTASDDKSERRQVARARGLSTKKREMRARAVACRCLAVCRRAMLIPSCARSAFGRHTRASARALRQIELLVAHASERTTARARARACRHSPSADAAAAAVASAAAACQQTQFAQRRRR